MSASVLLVFSATAFAPGSAGPPAGPPAGPGPRTTLSLEGDAAAGYLTLQWKAEHYRPGTEFLLQEATAGDFGDARTRYRGPQNASVISGLPDGAYFFRVRARRAGESSWGQWSTPQPFTVAHHPLSLAVLLLCIGAIVFGLTVSFLVVSVRRTSP